MDIIEIKNKLKQEEEALAELESKKKKLEEKISSKRKRIEEYERLIQSKLYADIDNQLDNIGISREDLLKALMNNDLLSLQEMIENKQTTNESTSTLGENEEYRTSSGGITFAEMQGKE